jgi:hydroxylysine kinase
LWFNLGRVEENAQIQFGAPTAATATPATQQSAAIDNLEEPPPEVSTDTAIRAAREIFGLHADAAQPLPGERDRNFLLVTDAGRFVMKVVHPAEDRAVSGFQAALLTHVQGRGVPAQTVIAPIDGREPIIRLSGTPPVSCRVRCVTYLAGERLADVAPTATRWRALGRFLADLDDALADFVEPRADRPFLWDIQRADQLRPLVEYVADASRRRRVAAILDTFAADVRPRLPTVRRQVIHNDANPQNVLVASDEHDRISGVIDFGDAVYGPVAQELAVAIAYQRLSGISPFEAAIEISRGFHESLALTDEELALIPALVATRLALITVITSWRSALHPENAAYIMRNDSVIASNLESIPALCEPTQVTRFVASIREGSEWSVEAVA